MPDNLSLENILLPELDQAGVQLQVLRLDQCCPQLSGNKFFKLKYNLLEASQLGYSRLLSFGGAFSNHIHALAQAGKAHDFLFSAAFNFYVGWVYFGVIQGAPQRNQDVAFGFLRAVQLAKHFFYLLASYFLRDMVGEYRKPVLIKNILIADRLG